MLWESCTFLIYTHIGNLPKTGEEKKMKKNHFRIFVIVLSLFLAFAIPTTALAGACVPPDQCGKNGVVCYPEDSPENAFCQKAEPGTRAAKGPLLKPEDIQHCIGVDGTIPLDECRESVAAQNADVAPVPTEGMTPSEILLVLIPTIVILGVVLYFRNKTA